MTSQLNQGLMQIEYAGNAQAWWQRPLLGLTPLLVGLVWVASGCGMVSPPLTLTFNSSDVSSSLAAASSVPRVTATVATRAVPVDEDVVSGGLEYTSEDKVAMVGIATAATVRIYQVLQAAVAVMGVAGVLRILQSYDLPSLGGFTAAVDGGGSTTTQHQRSEAELLPPRLGGFVDEAELAPVVLSQPKDTFTPLMVMAIAGDLAHVPPESREELVKHIQHSLETLKGSLSKQTYHDIEHLQGVSDDILVQIERYEEMRVAGEISVRQVGEAMSSLQKKNEKVRIQLRMVKSHFEDQIGKINAIKAMMDQILHDDAMHIVRKNLERQID